MQNKPFRFGPLYLTTTYTTNILNPGTTTGGVNGSGSPYGNLFIILTHVAIVNVTASAATFRLWIDSTGGNTGGKQVIGYDRTVAANSIVDWYGRMPLYVADFLVGGAGTATALVIQGEGEIGIA